MIRDLTSQAQPLKIHSKFKGKGPSGQSFLRLRRAKRGFAFGSVLHRPKSATLAVAIIPVTPQEGVDAPGGGEHVEITSRKLI